MNKINFHQLTSIGDRAENQDYMLNKIDSDYVLFLVADGLGGHEAGEKAARYFCQSFVKLAVRYGPLVNKKPKTVVRKWFNAAVELMADIFFDNPFADNAYTTCAILIMTSEHVISVHCGDSRIYRIKNNNIIWRTKDHSIPQRLLDEGQLAEHKMGTHPEQNQLTRSISVANLYKPDIEIYPAAEVGETFILCSDGFWEFTKEHEFIALANTHMHKSDLLKQAKMALFRANGKADNLTVQWLRVENKISNYSSIESILKSMI